MTASPDPDAIRAACRDLIADGTSRKDAVSQLCNTFGISQATAYRRMGETEADSASCRGESVNVAREAIGAMLSLMREAQDSGDGDLAFKRAQLLAHTLARLRILHL